MRDIVFFFFNDTATTEIYTLSLHDALPISAYLSRSSGETVEPAQVWAANGSNEVLQQVLQAFGGAGRTALGFTTYYSMHPIISAGNGHAWVERHRREDFSIDAAPGAAQVRSEESSVGKGCRFPWRA